MNRTDRSFNEVDPATGRPFSRGQPDGVWIISILYILALLGWLVRALMASKGAWHPQPFGAMLLVLTPLGILPSLVLLMRRKALAFSWMAGFFIILALWSSFYAFELARQDQLSPDVVVGLAFLVIGQGCAAYYVSGLVRDRILQNPAPHGRRA